MRIVPNRSWINPFLHLLMWVILLSGPANLIFSANENSDLAIRAAAQGLFMLIAFYLNYLVFIPRLLFRRRLTLYTVALLCLIILSFLLSRLILQITGGELNWKLEGVPRGMGPPAPFSPVFAVISTLILLAAGIAFRVTARWLSEERRLRELERSQLQTELALLKNQVSPHFFFNTLNAIYALIETEPERAQKVTLQLSRLMRYMLYESEKSDRIPLSSEVEFISAYLELMRVRLPEQVEIEFSHSGMSGSERVPPMLFIPFVENAFKHGVSYRQDTRIEVSLVCENSRLFFRVRNPLVAHSEAEPGGIGLSNIRRRLELLFPEGDYRLDLHSSDGHYTVELSIPI